MSRDRSSIVESILGPYDTSVFRFPARVPRVFQLFADSREYSPGGGGDRGEGTRRTREREREIGYFVARDFEMIRRVSTSTPGTTNVSSTMIFFSYFAWRDERYKKEKKKRLRSKIMRALFTRVLELLLNLILNLLIDQ